MKREKRGLNRRRFLSYSGLAAANCFFASSCSSVNFAGCKKPNVLFVLADQWRAQACGYAGDPNLKGMTPNLDKLASESVNLVNAISNCPVCTPYRASLMTGQYPLTNGLFLNDLCLSNEATSIAQAYNNAGYDTGFIGKWHLDGHGRSAYIPKERRQGFEYWKVLECTHNYNKSHYYDNDNPTRKTWAGYDVFAQTKDAQSHIRACADKSNPFMLILSWGPPHNPYQSAPASYRALFPKEKIATRPNMKGDFKGDLAGYYAHIAALDKSLGDLLKTIDDMGLRDDTIVVFTSDHGDMIGSHGLIRKQKPWDEVVRVPFLLRYPKIHKGGRKLEFPMGSPDIMPTLLGMCGIDIPDSVEGSDFSAVFAGAAEPEDHAALIQCPSPFGEWKRVNGGREYRGVRTVQYTFVRDLQGPWLMYDNDKDPYQLNNLVGNPEYAQLQKRLDRRLQKMLKVRGDTFERGEVYIAQRGYKVDKHGTVGY
ncbi:MAG: sulfatase [Kiritimatiellae bacterium]|jgi:arylsulfatase A-like enzyme|nr:sulfatase [Kiritimatiellia bacterium]